jgi:CRP-like cAMP-binding protein
MVDAAHKTGSDDGTSVIIEIEPVEAEIGGTAARLPADKIAALRQTRFFSQLSFSDLTDLVSIAKYREFKPGDTIITEGELPTAMWVVMSGSVEIKEGGRHVATRGPGNTLGESALLDNEPRSATVVAATELRSVEFSKQDLVDYLSEYMDSPAARIYKAISAVEHERLRDITEKFSLLMRRPS